MASLRYVYLKEADKALISWRLCGEAFTGECGFSTIVWLLLSKQSEKSGIPPSYTVPPFCWLYT